MKDEIGEEQVVVQLVSLFFEFDCGPSLGHSTKSANTVSNFYNVP